MAEQQIDKIYIDIQVKNTGLNTLRTATNNLQELVTNLNKNGVDISVTQNTLTTIQKLGDLYRELARVQRVISKPLNVDIQTRNTTASSRGSRAYRNGNRIETDFDVSGNQLGQLTREVQRDGYAVTNQVNAYGQSIKKIEEYTDDLGNYYRDIYNNTKNITDGITKSNYALDENGKKWLQTQTTIKQTQDGLEKVTTTFDKTGRTISTVTQTTDQFGNVIKTMPENLKKTRTSLSSFANGIVSAAAKLTILGYGLSQVSSWFSSFINESNSYIENLNLFRVTFGNMTDEAERFVETYSEALGLDPSQVMRNMGFFNQIVTGFGVSTEEGYQMSKLLTQLAYDLSSFVNIPIDEAMLKFQSGIAGELEPLRRVGYALDEATLQQVAYNHGIDESIRTMTQAEKAYIRLITMYEQSENVMGDLAATINSPANALRILDQEFTIFKRSIGNAIMPILTKLIPIVQGATRAFTEFFNMLAERMGYEIEGARENAYAEYMEEITASAEEAENAIEGTLLSFDKFSVLGSQDDEEENFTLPIPDYDALATLADSLYETSELGKATYQVIHDLLMDDENNLAPHLQAIVDLIKALWNVVSTLWSAFSPAFFAVLENSITPIIDGLAQIITYLSDIGMLEPLIFGALVFSMLNKVSKSLLNLIGNLHIVQDETKKTYNTWSNWVKLLAIGMSTFAIVDGMLSSLEPTMRAVAGALTLLAGAVIAATIAWAAHNTVISWGTALPIIMVSVGTAIAGLKNMFQGIQGVTGYATGGFTPMTSGSLFMAGENGRPELMGTVRGKNAVANVNSIEDAMEQASYRGMVSAIAQANRDSSNTNNTPIILQLDGREIARANVRNTANALSRNYRIELNPR